MTKKKFFEIVITALISAGIAFLTNLLSSLSSNVNITTDPEVAGGIGALIATIKSNLS